MNELQHHLPWRTAKSNWCEGYAFILDATGLLVGSDDLPASQADLIVRAVNSHGQLLAALEHLRSDLQCTLDLYKTNGPQWTSRESGYEYYDAGFVIESAQEKLQIIDAAIAAAETQTTE
jgi:hypothetical protein